MRVSLQHLGAGSGASAPFPESVGTPGLTSSDHKDRVFLSSLDEELANLRDSLESISLVLPMASAVTV